MRSRFAVNCGVWGSALLVSANACARMPAKAAPRPQARDVAAIDSIVDASRREFKLAAVSVVIADRRQVFLSKGYGLADRAGVMATDSTIYPIGSLSKQFTAAAIMRLAEDGRLNLSDPVARFFPELPIARDTSLRIENLLRQTSGIEAWDDYPELQGIEATRDSLQFPLSTIIQLIGARAPLYRPGTWWSYSNSNYTLLAALIERVTGGTYDQYLDREFWGPLGLRSTGSCAHQPIQLGGRLRAVGYRTNGDTLAIRALRPYLMPGMTGAGGLCSSARDIAVWMRALVGEKAVSRHSFLEMTATKPVAAGFTPPYGFGLSLRPVLGEAVVWHEGVMAGYTSLLAWLPERDLVIALITNGRPAPVDEMLRRIARQLTGRQTPALRDLPLPSPVATRVAGQYDDAMFKYQIVADSGGLFFHGPFGAPQRLLYQGGRDFAIAGPGDFRFSFQPDTGAAKWVEWDWGEIRAYGRRVP